VSAVEERIASALKAGTDLEESVAAVRRLEAGDKRFLHEMKLALRTGVRIFERWERDTFAEGGPELLSAVEALPGVLERYLSAMSTVVAGTSGGG
jgi:type II secretory pathway component PulF